LFSLLEVACLPPGSGTEAINIINHKKGEFLMAIDFTASLRNAAASVAKYVDDAATMEVVTKYVEIGDDSTLDFDAARPVARTIIKLDSDSETIFPMRAGQGDTLEVDMTLFELHQQNVSTAIDYRARILDALLSTVMSREGEP
jgi:hypothetical protein